MKAVVSTSYHDALEDFGMNKRVPINRKKFARKAWDSAGAVNERQAYVPQVSVEQAPIPSGIDLMHMKNRFYLKPTPESKVEAILNEGVRINTIRHTRLNDLLCQTEEESIDLGVVQLRRIVEQLKGLKSNSKAKNFDPLASRAAGLPSYCDYLHGKEPSNASIQVLLKELYKSSKS